jgi:hypothetical protein
MSMDVVGLLHLKSAGWWLGAVSGVALALAMAQMPLPIAVPATAAALLLAVLAYLHPKRAVQSWWAVPCFHGSTTSASSCSSTAGGLPTVSLSGRATWLPCLSSLRPRRAHADTKEQLLYFARLGRPPAMMPFAMMPFQIHQIPSARWAVTL